MIDAKRLGNNVLLARRDLDMTQEYLASRVGVSRAYIANIEAGRAENVGIEILDGIATELGVTLPYLLGLADNALGENPQAVLREMAGEYLTVDVESREQRQVLQQALDALTGMSQREQQRAVRLLRALREEEEEERRRDLQQERDLQQLRSMLDMVEAVGGAAALDALLEILVVAESDPAAALARMDAFFAVSGQPVGRRRRNRAIRDRLLLRCCGGRAVNDDS